MSTILYVLLALVMLGIMVAVHEAGHYFAARACGIAVRAFGIGFGPKLFGWTGKKNGTEYVFRLIPGGGYCAFYGEDDTQTEPGKEDPRSLQLQAPWKRLIVLFAGPFMNFVLAFVVALAFYTGYGLPYAGDQIETEIISVQAGSPADVGGMKAGDIVLAMDGQPVTDNFIALMEAWDGKQPIELIVQRGEEQTALYVTPDYISTENRYMMGVTLTMQAETVWIRESFGKTVNHTFNVCVSAGGAILNAIKNLVTRGEGLDQMSGPVGVISIIAKETQTYQLMGYLNMLIMISINLGLVNLLPIPGLDGCRILFVIYEMIFRKPVNRRTEAYIHLVGYGFLMLVMIYFTFHDVLSIFG
ncbi:MAG: site-2 protease family protein [Clostridia bacterium]|nr:site-2 protease family protein [Clostridia bacterium]